MFSFGVLLWELITLEPPRRGNLRELEVPKECPAAVRSCPDAEPTLLGAVCRPVSTRTQYGVSAVDGAQMPAGSQQQQAIVAKPELAPYPGP